MTPPQSPENNAQPRLVPKLRFPKFRDEPGWDEKELRTLADPVSERAANEDENNILTLSAEQGLVLQSEYFGKQIAGTNAERYLRIQRDDFVYNDRITKASAYGTIKRLKEHAHGIVSPIYKCFRFKTGELPSFWEWYFEAGAHEAQLRGLANEGARAGRFNVSIERFLSTNVRTPNPKSQEQQAIAHCLTSLEDLIAAESKWLAALKAHKKGLMRQLLPSEGETRPRLRFPEFCGEPEWKEDLLGSLGKFTRGLTYSSTDVAPSGMLVLRSSNIQEGDLILDEDLVFVNKACPEALRIRKGDVVICMSNGSKALVGKNAEYMGDYDKEITVGAFCSFFRPDLPFAKLVFQTEAYCRYIADLVSGGNINNLNNSALEEFRIWLPRTPPEQQKIAACFISLDELIAAQKKQLEALNTHKSGLLQQLFPRPSEPAA